MNIAWTIAGSDSSGGAGITADLLTFNDLNVHGCSIITAATAQNTNGVQAINLLSSEQIKSQLYALHESHIPQAIKIGMIGSIETIEILEKYFKITPAKIILDPVMISSSGDFLFDGKKENYIQHLKKLFPFVDLLTPNIPEAENLTGNKIHSHDDMINAANKILSLGAASVVIKGGHFFADENECQDYWTDGESSFWLISKRYPQKNYRGTGCVFSSGVSASLASGYEMKDALVIAKMMVSRGIRLSKEITNDIAYLHHDGVLDDINDLPYLSPSENHEKILFPPCDEIGLYPVVDNCEWLRKLLPLGIKTIQLRIKQKNPEQEIKSAIELAKKYQAKLFINDHWELAIAHGAYGVHLGQEDLHTADIKKIHAAGLHLGISTHCYHEIARAYAYQPSYFAFGPIYHTNTKVMAFSPQGIEKLSWYRKLLKSHNIVAIGGINENNIADVLQTGVDGVALISAITNAINPENATRQLLKQINA